MALEHLPDDKEAVCFLHIFLEDGIGMENLRAYMIVNAVQECGIDLRYYPENMESDSSTSASIIEEGFFMAFTSEDDANKASDVLRTQNYIRSYELAAVPEPEPEPEIPVKEEPAKSAAPAAAPKPVPAPQKPAPAKQASAPPVKQNLISVSLMRLDSLQNIVGEIVITESMVTSAPELNQLSRDAYDNFMKSARQLRKLTDT